jgi:RNA recognition motif-containing protein
MSDYKNNPAGNRGRRRRGGRDRNRNSSSSSSSSTPGSYFKPRQPSGFEKFLSFITFGFLGKSKPRPTGKSEFTAEPQRTPREVGPIARGDRETRDSSRRESKPPRQQPHSAEVTGDRLYVGNLSYDASESDLLELFKGSGRVKNAEVVINNRTQRSKGFAFVTMMSTDEAKKAVADLNNKDFMGRPLVVGGAKPLLEGGRREDGRSQAQDDDTIRPPAEDSEEEQHNVAA